MKLFSTKLTLLIVLVCCLFSANTNAQVLYSQDFEGTGGVMPSELTIYNVDGNVINPSFGAPEFEQWVVVESSEVPGDTCVAVSSWLVDGAGAPAGADDWLVTPAISGLSANAVLKWEAASRDATYPDGYEVYVSTTGNAVADFTATTPIFSIAAELEGTHTARTESLAAYAGQTVYVAFRAISTDAFILEIDNIVVENAGPDATVTEVWMNNSPLEYAVIPASQASDIMFQAELSNQGGADANDVMLTTNVYLDLDMAPIATYSSTPIATLAPGGTQLVTTGPFTPDPNDGLYFFEYVVSISNTDDDMTNDTLLNFVLYDDSSYFRDVYGVLTGAPDVTLGIGAGGTATLGNVYDINTATDMTTVEFVAFGWAPGDTTRVVVYDMDATTGLPSTLIGTSGNFIFPTTADTSFTLPVSTLAGGTLSLMPGAYYVGVEEFFSTDNIALAATEFKFTPGHTIGNINGGAFTPLEQFGFPISFAVRPNLAAACPDIIVAISTADENCNSLDGTAAATTTDGMMPYTYMWSDGQMTQTASGLAAGSYSVTVTDANGCTGTMMATVGSAGGPNVTLASQTNVSCNGGADGTATLSVTGGMMPYTYIWSDGQTTDVATGLMVGAYSVTVTDANGCAFAANDIVTITEPMAISLSGANVSNISCNGLTDGAIDITVSGGTAPYTFSWSNGATTEDVTGLMAGDYSGTITDANGCTFVAGPVSITEPTAISVAVDATTPDFGGATPDGSISITVSGGTAPYTFSWSNGATTEDLTALAAGDYTGTITDANGCTLVAGPVTVADLTNVAEVSEVSNLAISPVPATDVVTVNLELDANYTVNLQVVDVAGRVLESIEQVDIDNAVITINVSDYPQGVYFFNFTVNNKRFSEKITVVR